jgi:hypothetical protein
MPIKITAIAMQLQRERVRSGSLSKSCVACPFGVQLLAVISAPFSPPSCPQTNNHSGRVSLCAIQPTN